MVSLKELINYNCFLYQHLALQNLLNIFVQTIKEQDMMMYKYVLQLLVSQLTVNTQWSLYWVAQVLTFLSGLLGNTGQFGSVQFACAVCSLKCVVSTVHLQCAVSSVHCEVCNVKCSVCSLGCAMFSI